ncbi:MAG TPA: hypothetical protein VHG09_07095 [Longimicrobiales bacterium]|nr:hypothetical protein [Longimicrobiales bacterium]
MRRTTQWAVFTSMNKQQPAWRSLYEPPERVPAADNAAENASISTRLEPEPRTAPHERRDRVDFM